MRSDPENPFLACLVPVALHSEPVRCALLALAGLSAGPRNLPWLQQEVVDLQSRALEESRTLYLWALNLDAQQLSRDFNVFNSPEVMFVLNDTDNLCLVTTAVLLALLGKLSGQEYNRLRSYLQFGQHYLKHKSAADPTSFRLTTTPIQDFLLSLITYNCLLADIGETHSFCGINGTFQSMPALSPSHFRTNFEALLWRVGNDVENVSLADFSVWSGDFGFLPSCSTKPAAFQAPCADVRPYLPCSDGARLHVDRVNETFAVQEIYRISSQVYFFRQLRDRIGLAESITTRAYPPFIAQARIRKLAHYAIDLIRILPENSRFNSTLLLPLGLVAPELTSKKAQTFVLQKLALLERLFSFDVFLVFSKDLVKYWAQSRSWRQTSDEGRTYSRAMRAARLIG
jgi:hypothetical protein